MYFLYSHCDEVFVMITYVFHQDTEGETNVLYPVISPVTDGGRVSFKFVAFPT